MVEMGSTVKSNPSITAHDAQDDEEAPLVRLHSPGSALQAPAQPWYKDRRNIGLVACFGTLLLVLVVAAAVAGSRPRAGLAQPSTPPSASPQPNPTPKPQPSPSPSPTPTRPTELFSTPTPTTDYRGRPRRVASNRGVVASDQSVCAEIGAAVMREGGNAADAAVATCLCQGVVNPFASGIGGGFFAVVRGPNGTAEMIDARETAPEAASWDMYTGMPANASTDGGLAIAVPLELKGLELLWRRWGKLSWSRLVTPSATLARTGQQANPYLVYMLTTMFNRLTQYPLTASQYLIRDSTSVSGWRVPRVGELCCVRPTLANTLDNVAQYGSQWLYSPERAHTLASEIQAIGGILTAKDFIQAQPLVTPVIPMMVDRYELLLPPPPSSAAVMGLALRILTGYPPPDENIPTLWSGFGSASDENLEYEHYLVESLKDGFACRLALGDPGPQFVTSAIGRGILNATGPIPPGFANITGVFRDLLDPAFAAELRSDLREDGILNKTQYGRQWNPYHNNDTASLLHDDHGTSHISVVDSDQLAVSLTTTINGPFGANVVSPSTGILWNNEMDDFSRPDLPNVYGLAPSPVNFIAPTKRPLSSMSPTIILEDGELRMVVGASNGPRIISATLQTIIRVLVMGWDVLDAVSVPRVHHQLLPFFTRVENFTMPAYAGSLQFRVSDQLQRYLKEMGNDIVGESGQLGNSQVIYFPQGSKEAIAASDPRKDGAPAAV